MMAVMASVRRMFPAELRFILSTQTRYTFSATVTSREMGVLAERRRAIESEDCNV